MNDAGVLHTFKAIANRHGAKVAIGGGIAALSMIAGAVEDVAVWAKRRGHKAGQHNKENDRDNKDGDRDRRGKDENHHDRDRDGHGRNGNQKDNDKGRDDDRRDDNGHGRKSEDVSGGDNVQDQSRFVFAEPSNRAPGHTDRPDVRFLS
jgi:hypothetical protein